MPGHARSLRLLADDLTGALDSAAAFASPTAPVPVRWRGTAPASGAVAWDSGTREASAENARAAVDAIASPLMDQRDALPFKKIDSLLRGNEAAEIACLLRRIAPLRCIIAPAFPAQGRVTRGGRQHVWTGGAFEPVPTDLRLALSHEDVPVVTLQPGEPAPPGVSIWDARHDDDLDAVVAAAADLPGVLWVGSAGLANALARAEGPPVQAPATPLARPILGLVGSEHDVTRAQLRHIGRFHRVIEPTMIGSAATVRLRLDVEGAAFITVDLPPGTSRRDGATSIQSCFASLLQGLERPGALFVTGGETLRAICEALGADQLDVLGSIVPGVPRARLRGGRWDNVDVISKSGAFGTPELFKRLIMDEFGITVGAAL